MEYKILKIKIPGENYDYRETKISICPLYVDAEDRITKIFNKNLYTDFDNLIKNSKFKTLNFRNKYNENIKLNGKQISKLFKYSITELSHKYSYLDIFNIASEYFDIETRSFLAYINKKDKLALVSFIKKSRQLSI